MKKYFTLVFFLVLSSIISGVLFSKMSFLARASMSILKKKYLHYSFLKIWWQGALFVFVVLIILLLFQLLLQKKLLPKHAFRTQLVCVFLAVVGLYLTYQDFTHTLSHRWAGERLHLGFYIFWLSWIVISVFLLFTNKAAQTIDTDKMEP